MKKILLIIGLLVLLVITMTPFYAGPLMDHWSMKGATPSERHAFRQWNKRELIIPRGALDVKPFRPEVLAAARAFYEEKEKQNLSVEGRSQPSIHKLVWLARKLDEANAWMNLAKDRNSSATLFPEALFSDYGDEFGPDDVAPCLQRAQPIFDRFRAMVQQPDYEMQAVREHYYYNTYFDNGASCAHLMANTLRFQALVEIRQGRFNAAVENAAILAKSSRVNPYGNIYQQERSIIVCDHAISVWEMAVSNCDDNGLLRAALQQQNLLAKEINWLSKLVPASDPDSEVASGSLIAFTPSPLTIDNQATLHAIRELKRIGYKPDMGKIRKAHPFCAADLAWVQYMKKAELRKAQAKGDIEKVKVIQEWIDFTEQEYAFFDFKPKWGWFDYQSDNANRIMTAARVVRTHLDLLRLKTAEKIYALEHGKAPSKVEDLVPDLLPGVPFDRFSASSRASYRHNGIEHYSLGPDQIDQNGALQYDPTNGSQSRGDIYGIVRPYRMQIRL